MAKQQKTLASRGNPAKLRREVEQHLADGWEVLHRTAVEVIVEKKTSSGNKKTAAPAVVESESSQSEE